MKLRKLEDHDLVAQYRDGNEQAFEVLIRRHQKRIFLHIYYHFPFLYFLLFEVFFQYSPLDFVFHQIYNYDFLYLLAMHKASH
mgnify:CR=1 FL=1